MLKDFENKIIEAYNLKNVDEVSTVLNKVKKHLPARYHELVEQYRPFKPYSLYKVYTEQKGKDTLLVRERIRQKWNEIADFVCSPAKVKK